MKQSTMRLRSVTLKWSWLGETPGAEIVAEEQRLMDCGLDCVVLRANGFAYLPSAPLSPILPTSGPE